MGEIAGAYLHGAAATPRGRAVVQVPQAMIPDRQPSGICGLYRRPDPERRLRVGASRRASTSTFGIGT